jgi:hypothetical protein
VTAPKPPLTVSGLGVEAIIDSPPAQVDANVVALATAERIELEKGLLGSELKDREQDRSERFKYGQRIFRLLVGWLVVLGLVVVAEGIHFFGFHLSDPVIIALVGSTTASVISIFLIVANYLFPRGPRQKS